MNDLLEVLRVQRHNFLNHLQVISGLLQLKKHDRIMDYIIQIGNEYNKDSLVARLEVPEIVAAILSSELAAGKQGIKINKKITTDLDKGIYKAEEAAEILKEIITVAIGMMENLDFQQREFEMEVKEEAANYIFRVNLTVSGLKEDLDQITGALKKKALIAEGEIEAGDDDGLSVFTLKIPVYDNNTDK